MYKGGNVFCFFNKQGNVSLRIVHWLLVGEVNCPEGTRLTYWVERPKALNQLSQCNRSLKRVELQGV
jgi:hypothetical protein